MSLLLISLSLAPLLPLALVLSSSPKNFAYYYYYYYTDSWDSWAVACLPLWLVSDKLSVCSECHAWISNPMPPIILNFKSHTWSVMNLQSAVYVMPGFEIPCLQSSSMLNSRPGQPWSGSVQCISSLDFRSHVSGHPRFEIQGLANHRLADCSVFQAWISDPMPQSIPDCKFKTWGKMHWQSTVYIKVEFQIPCIRSSLILNPRPGKPQIGSLQCFSCLDFKSHASDHPRFSIQDMGHHGLAVCGVFHAWISDPMPQIILNFKSKAW